MTEAVSKDYFAAFVNEVKSRFITNIGFGDISFIDNLILFESERFCSSFYAVDEVEVVCGFFIVKKNYAEFEVR